MIGPLNFVAISLVAFDETAIGQCVSSMSSVSDLVESKKDEVVRTQ